MKTNIKLNFLIVMPLFRDNFEESYIFPLGIPYVSAAMKNADFSVFTLNLNHHENPYDVLKKMIQESNINVVLSGGNSPQYNEIKVIFDIAKKVDTNIITICGGGVISSDAIAAMTAFEIVDYGVIGEGEITDVELCKCIEENGDLNSIDGIILKENGQYRKTALRKEISDIDTIPWPDYEGFEFEKFLELSYVGTNGMNFSKAAMILTSRSCPFSCTFCFHTSGKKYRQRSLDDVFKEIDYLYTTYDIGFLYVLDELFSQSEQRVKEFCERIKQYEIPWNASFRVDGITENILSYLKTGNCYSISFGIESADNGILKSMKKHISIDTIESALEMSYNAKMNVTGSLIFGDKNQTVATSQVSLNWWKNHTQYGLHMKMITPFPGTDLYFHALKEGIITDPVQYLKDGCPPVNVSKMSDYEMGELVKEVTVLPFNSNPKIMNLTLQSLDPRTSLCSLEGNCEKCNSHNIWNDTQLFTANYVTCTECNETLSIDIPLDIVSVIDTNIQKLLKANNKIAFWGMANYAISYLDNSVCLQNKDIYLVDLSPTKQLITIDKKCVVSPEMIQSESIDVVVILVPQFGSSIKTLIQSKYHNVKVLSVYELFHSNFDMEK